MCPGWPRPGFQRSQVVLTAKARPFSTSTRGGETGRLRNRQASALANASQLNSHDLAGQMAWTG